MPYADVLVKPNHFFGTVQGSGIYLYKPVSSHSLDPCVPTYLFLLCGCLLMRMTLQHTFRMRLLWGRAKSSPYSPHLPDERDGSPY